MPEVDGFEAAIMIREWFKERGRISTRWTAHAREWDRMMRIEGGMDDYIGKPM